MSEAATRRITLLGSFGYGNAGDEAVPLALSDAAAALGLALAFDLVGRWPQTPDPSVIDLGPQDAARREALRGQPLVFAGGGVIEPGKMGVFTRCWHLRRELAPSRVSLLGASVDAHVAYPWRRRWALQRSLRRVHRVTLRDVLGAETLKQVAPRIETRVVGDTVLWMKPDPLPASVAELGPYVAVSLMDEWDAVPGFDDWLAAHLVRLARELDAKIVYAPCSFEYSTDIEVHRRVRRAVERRDPGREQLEIEAQLDPRQLAGILGASRLTVGMRLHSCVMAYAQQAPFVGLAYHPKLLGFSRTVGHERFILPAGSTRPRGLDVRLEQLDLARTGLEAVAKASFERLPELRERLLAEMPACFDLD